MITDWAPDDVVVEVRAADAAARAARAVPGVVRLQPGVFGLLARFAAQAFERVTGQELPDIAGVQAQLCGGPGDDPEHDSDRAVQLELQIVVDGGYRVAAVAAMVAHAVTAVVPPVTGVGVAGVRVHVVEIDLYEIGLPASS